MIFKINSDFTDINIFLEQFKNDNIYFSNNAMYVSCGIDMTLEEMRKLVGTQGFVTTVTPESLMVESMQIQQWCKDEFVKQDRQRYERDKQDHLQYIMSQLDSIEQEFLC